MSSSLPSFGKTSTKRDVNVNGQTFQASLAPAIPESQLVPMHLEDLKKPASLTNPPLSDDEVKSAREAGMINKELTNTQVSAFRRMRQTRHYLQPDGQKFAVISWVPSTKGKPDPDNCYGLMRIAGCFATQAEADRHAEKLLRTDSTREFLITFVGLDFPLTTDNFGVLKTEEIDLQGKTEDIEAQNARRVAELEEQKAREIEDARDNLLNDVSKKRTADDLDTYIELCVKQAHSEAERTRAIEQIEKCNRVVVATEPLLKHIAELHPEYKTEAPKTYASACARVGIDPAQSAVSQFLDFERLKPHQVENAPVNPLQSGGVDEQKSENVQTGTLTLGTGQVEDQGETVTSECCTTNGCDGEGQTCPCAEGENQTCC